MEYVINKEYSGKTVREIARLLGLSMAALKHLKFLEEGILLNGMRVTVRAIANEGDVLTLAFEDTENSEKVEPVDIPISIAYEDEYLVVPNKPADMPTHPSRDHYTDTVANALAYRYRDGGAFVFRPVNRLDRNTSGLLIIARDRISANTLSACMRDRKINKQYIAVLDGVPPENEGIIDTYMRRTANSIIVRENCHEGEGGDRAITEYKVLLSQNGKSVVLAKPLTGRTHQLRVHFAGIGCPIAGDDMYGSASPYIKRHALHSFFLTFPHPRQEMELTVTAPLPTDMLALLGEIFTTNAIKTLSDFYPKLFENYF